MTRANVSVVQGETVGKLGKSGTWPRIGNVWWLYMMVTADPQSMCRKLRMNGMAELIDRIGHVGHRQPTGVEELVWVSVVAHTGSLQPLKYNLGNRVTAVSSVNYLQLTRFNKTYIWYSTNDCWYQWYLNKQIKPCIRFHPFFDYKETKVNFPQWVSTNSYWVFCSINPAPY